MMMLLVHKWLHYCGALISSYVSNSKLHTVAAVDNMSQEPAQQLYTLLV
jgi:hypothetical protein